MSEQQSRSRKRKHESNKDVLNAILARLNTLEERFTSPPPPSEPLLQAASTSSGQAPHPVLPALMIGAATDDVRDDDSTAVHAPVSVSRESIATGGDTTGRIVEAITSLVKVRSNNYYISNFDPHFHNIDVWCEEVDRAKETNGWDDNECLSRIGNFLKGEARVWLSEWSSTDRSWTNFKQEFKMLCPRTLDIASILYEVMTKDSKSYATYAEYARRSLLRLGLVRGLSDELIVAIVLRGITDPHIKAAATNAKLQPNDLVHFLSMYIKPKNDFPSTRDITRGSHPSSESNITRRNENKKGVGDLRCHFCRRFGHKRIDSKKAKRMRLGNNSGPSSSNTQSPHSVTCSFCKKSGHEINDCFAKQRSDSTKLNPHNVNFYSKLDSNVSRSTIDVTSAVIEGVPIDLLVDSGSCISLVSSSLLKHFKVNQRPTYHILRGIGSQLIECTSFVTLIVELPHISIETEFYVVPHDCISTPVIIGTDILNREGITYIQQNGFQILTRTGKPLPVNHAFDINNVNTPLKGEEKEQLLLVISDFSKFFITGTASSTVTTGSMKIELSNNKPVCYRPYKLSYDEKLRVRSIVKDLMDKGIIRESESPYAGPVILVKKKDGTDRMCVDYRVLNSRTVKKQVSLATHRGSH
ncbi:unnamed protein product [Parnassius mnemosyne]|uniref:Gag-pol polyprotein n=1 Tax=Parnassius mnemosyne TaxID=213953 RepID=A0AAV1KQP4_9NEOP